MTMIIGVAAMLSALSFGRISSFTRQSKASFFYPTAFLALTSGVQCLASPSFLAGRGGAKRSTTSIRSAISPETETTMTLTAAERLDRLRNIMKEEGLDIYLVPSDDPHLSEYTPEAYKRRGFISGFSGSAGSALITQDEAMLWTDSRYWNEASLQLDSECWTLQKQGLPATPTIQKWIAERAAAKYKETQTPLTIGIDPYVFAASFPKDLETALNEAKEEEMIGMDDETEVKIGDLMTLNSNLVDKVWGEARPPLPLSPFRVHPLEYAGMSLADKVQKIRQEMESKKATMSVFCTLDDVAYLFNVRAKGDIETCPVGIAYATVSMDDVCLYCDPAKVSSPEVQEHLSDVTIKPYDSISEDIAAHCSASKTNRVWLDKSRANYAISEVIPTKALIDSQNAVVPMKASKNDAELKGMREAHIVDGAAMAEFMAWLEDTIVNEGRAVSEVEIDEKLTGCRAKQPGFVEVSFPTIAGVGSNGAIIHYRAEESSDLLQYLDDKKPILIDSGGQYEYGTTDVTRTWHFGKADAEFVDMYTRVLKGNIGLDEMIFPENTPGFVLDVYARRWLWDAQRDYGHGTGHGVGAALNVHEGPMSISPRWGNKESLKQGMVLSNEPGFYADGRFGIRIENLLEIQLVNPEEDTGEDGGSEKKFFKFAKLTMIPIQKNLIDVSLMTEKELDWLDAYHQEVLSKVGPLLEDGSPAMAWLKKSCEPIERK